MLISGLGLVAVVAWDLWTTVQEQEERAEAVARREAEHTARVLRHALVEPSTVRQIPNSTGMVFDLVNGDLVVPSDVRWLEPPPRFDFERDIDVVARAKLEDAERLDGTAWVAARSKLHADPALSAVGRLWMVVHAAWSAHRRGEAVIVDQWLAQIDGIDSPDAAASALLLYAATQRRLPAWGRDALAAIDESRAYAVLDRLGEHGADVVDLRGTYADVVARRDAMRRVRPLVPLLSVATAPIARSLGVDLMLYWPGQASGMLVPRSELFSLFRDLEVPELQRGEGRLALANSPDRVAVVPGCVWLDPVLGRNSGFSGGTGLALIAIALAVLCGGGTLLAVRAVQREAEATALRGEFLTTVTHELKTPLAGIRLLTEMLADNRVTDDASRRSYLARLSGEAVRLSMLIENVLDFGRLERGERVHDPRRSDLVAVVRDTIELFAPLGDRDGLAVELESAHRTIDAEVDCDALRQALLNLLDNARKYAADGERVRVEISSVGEGAVIRVRDFGCGVDEAEREGVFDRFRRGRRHRHGGTPGVGLGLNLARAIARRHGGDLTCVSPPDGGAGACFEMMLPRAAGQVLEEPAA